MNLKGKLGLKLVGLLIFVWMITGCVISPRRTLGGSSDTSSGSPSPTPTPVSTPTPTPIPTPTPTPIPTPTPSPTPTPTPAQPTGQLYVTSGTQDSITRFDNAFAATGNVTPAATITGTATTLSQPVYLAVDSTTDTLYVASRNDASVVVFDQASAKTGNASPSRKIAGVATTLFVPTQVFLDKARDLLYVADELDILVFSPASTANGNLPPQRDIVPGGTIGAIYLDSTNDRLFVADPAGNAIDIYDSASTLNGSVTATRQISGASTGLDGPAGLEIDGGGRLIVGNASPTNGAPSITFYNAASASGDIAPAATVTGSSTGLVEPNQLAIDIANDTLYVADPGAGKVLIFANQSTASGNVPPTRSISGAATTLSTTASNTGIALDTAR